MKKYIPYLISLFLIIVSTSYIVIQTYTTETPLEKIVKETPTNKLPLFIILCNMDVKGWSSQTPDSARFFHQYKIITNADNPRKMKVKNTDFIRVSKKDFLKNYRNIDMEVMSKVKVNSRVKVGKIIAPPGYTHCIGNKKYGQWKVNIKSGETTWQFYKKHQNLVKAFGLADFTIQNYHFNHYYKNYQEKKPYYGTGYRSPHGRIHFGTFSDFSKNIRRSESFYGTDREQRVKKFYQNRDYSSTGMSGYIKYPVDKLLANTPTNKLPLSIVLYDMDVKGSRYLNRYKVITNVDDSAKKKEVITPWLRLSKADFVRNYQNLGMEIAYQKITSSAGLKLSKIPAPPGYANYVGNSQYGHWKQQTDSTSLWVFQGKYVFMNTLFHLTNYPVYKNSYNNYRRYYFGRRVYYGGTGTRRRYGTGTRFSQSTSSTDYYTSERANRSRTHYRQYRSSRKTRSGSRSGYNSRSRSGSSGK